MTALRTLLAFLVGVVLAIYGYQTLVKEHWAYSAPGLAFSAEEPIVLPGTYDYETVSELLGETNPARAAALFAMISAHNLQPFSDQYNCGDIAGVQRDFSLALGLSARIAVISGGTHAWTEVLVDQQWEVFDGTTNVWISRSGTELLSGVDRDYRLFYLPELDRSRPDSRNSFTLSLLELRAQLPGLGLYYTPKAVIEIL